MAKVLISHFSGVFDKQWETTVFYDGLINALVRNGNEVLHLVSNDFITTPWAGQENTYISGINISAVEKRLKSFAPDFVICFNNSTVPNLDKIVECPIFIWDADASYYFCGLENLKKFKDRYQFLSFSHSGRKEIQKNIGVSQKDIILLSSATDIRNKIAEKQRNIVFIGSNFKTDDKLKKELLTDRLLRKISLEAFQKSDNDFQTLVDLLGVFPAETVKALSTIQSANMRVKALDAIADLGLVIFGTPSWIQLIDFSVLVALSYNDSKVYTQTHNEAIYNSSKIGFSISHNQSKTGFPWRIYDIMASDACLVADYKNDLFEETRGHVEELPLYHSPIEARNLCKKILNDEGFRNQIVTQSNNYINMYCRFEHRFRVIEQILNVKLVDVQESGKYERFMPGQTLFGEGLNNVSLCLSKLIPYAHLKLINRVILRRLGVKAPSSLIKQIQKAKGEID